MKRALARGILFVFGAAFIASLLFGAWAGLYIIALDYGWLVAFACPLLFVAAVFGLMWAIVNV